MMNINSYVFWHWIAIIKDSTKTEDFMLLILCIFLYSVFREGLVERRIHDEKGLTNLLMSSFPRNGQLRPMVRKILECIN
jgi:hypothetical protein